MMKIRLRAKKTIFFVSITVLVVVFLGIYFLPQNIKANLTNSVIVRQFLPLYRSLKKIPDVVFLPYLFTPISMEKINIVIDPKDIYYMNDFLPKSSPFTSVSLDSNRVFTKARFTGQNYQDNIKIRYKGLGANHWNSFKKSYRIQFPKENLYDGSSGLNLVIPDDKAYYADLLNEYRAKKLGLLTKKIRFANVTINGQSHGVYIASDNWSHEFLSGRRIPENSNLLGLDEAQFLPTGDFKNYESISAFSSPYLGVWKSYSLPEEVTSFEEIKTLINLVENADDETFKRLIPNIVNMDSFYSWDIINILAGNIIVDYENIVMVFNIATGKFEFMLIDTYATDITNEYKEQSLLAQRILSIDDFKKERDRLLGNYINNKSNIEDDLAFYDTLYKDTRSEFFRDFVKSETSFSFIKKVKDTRDTFKENFKKASMVFGINYENPNKNKTSGNPVFSGSFERFAETGITRDQFLYKNKNFVARGDNGVALLPGEYVFYRDVVIPSDVEFFIDPGTTIYLAENISIIAYGPIQAIGTEWSPIVITGLNQQKKWGIFASVNAKKVSMVEHVIFDGGSGATINGIVFTGMASFHGSDVQIKDSYFSNAGNDDGLNVKYAKTSIEGSTFEKNYSDALDIDFAMPESQVVKNIFKNNGYGGGGDAVDLSWADNIVIKDNNIDGCTDKGVSVGEHSSANINNNRITHCPIGVAAKDLSEIYFVSNTLSDLNEGISAYRKKAVFGGGTVHESKNIFDRVKVNYKKDEFSSIQSY